MSPCATGDRSEALDGMCIMSRAAAIIRSVPMRWDSVAAGLSSIHSFSGSAVDQVHHQVADALAGAAGGAAGVVHRSADERLEHPHQSGVVQVPQALGPPDPVDLGLVVVGRLDHLDGVVDDRAAVPVGAHLRLPDLALAAAAEDQHELVQVLVTVRADVQPGSLAHDRLPLRPAGAQPGDCATSSVCHRGAGALPLRRARSQAGGTSHACVGPGSTRPAGTVQALVVRRRSDDVGERHGRPGRPGARPDGRDLPADAVPVLPRRGCGPAAGGVRERVGRDAAGADGPAPADVPAAAAAAATSRRDPVRRRGTGALADPAPATGCVSRTSWCCPGRRAPGRSRTRRCWWSRSWPAVTRSTCC